MKFFLSFVLSINQFLSSGFLSLISFPVWFLLFSSSSVPVEGRSSLFPFEDGFLDDGHGDQSLTPGLSSPTRCQNGERMERYSRKVFVGGLPPDIDEGTCTHASVLSLSLEGVLIHINIE